MTNFCRPEHILRSAMPISQHLSVGKLKQTAKNIFTSAWFQYRNWNLSRDRISYLKLPSNLVRSRYVCRQLKTYKSIQWNRHRFSAPSNVRTSCRCTCQSRHFFYKIWTNKKCTCKYFNECWWRFLVFLPKVLVLLPGGTNQLGHADHMV